MSTAIEDHEPVRPVYAIEVRTFKHPDTGHDVWGYRVEIRGGRYDGFVSDFQHLHTATDQESANAEARRLVKEFMAVNIGGKFFNPRPIDSLKLLPAVQPEDAAVVSERDDGLTQG